MKPVIRSIHSSDVDLDTGTWFIEEQDGFPLALGIGPDDGPGEEFFQILVCTPAFLERSALAAGGLISGRHSLIMDRLDIPRAVAYMRRTIEELEASTWGELAQLIGRHALWEFEDYRAIREL